MWIGNVLVSSLHSLLALPVLLLGEQEAIYKDLQSAVRSAQELIPSVQIEIIPNAHHVTAIANPEVVNQKLLEFFAEQLPPI